jgi:hypothetical protein
MKLIDASSGEEYKGEIQKLNKKEVQNLKKKKNLALIGLRKLTMMFSKSSEKEKMKLLDLCLFLIILAKNEFT